MKRSSFRIKDFASRLNSIIMMIALIGILVMMNVIADRLPWTYDMTVSKIFTLSDQTQKVLQSLSKKVEIIAFYQEGTEDRMVKTLLEEYQKAAPGRIKFHIIDADKEPALAKKYDINNEGISNGCIVFACDGKVKKISQIQIVTPGEYGRTFNGEQQFTGAIIYITAQRFQKVYFLEGHQEMNPNDDISKLKGRIEGEASVVESLNLLKSGSIPQDADVIVSASPKRDLMVEEKMKLQDFLEKGGRAIFMFDILNPNTQLPQFNELLKGYGIAIHNNFVVEEDSQSFYSNNKMCLVPDYEDQSIVTKLKSDNLYVFLPYAGKIDMIQGTSSTIKVEPLLKTSAQSWVRSNVLDETPNKTAADQSGPAVLAVAITKDNSNEKYRETKMVVTYNAKFATDGMLDMQGNFDFIMNAFSWVQDHKESMAVRPKMLDTKRMYVKGVQSIGLMVLSVLVIPLIAFGAGFFVWLRRKHL